MPLFCIIYEYNFYGFIHKFFPHFLLLFKYNCLHFLPTTPLQPQLAPLPTLDPTPVWFCPSVLYTCSRKPCPLFPPLSPPTSPLVTVSLFLISMSLVIFCLLICFVDQVPLISEIIRCVSFTACLISLSIMFSRSIHAVAKGRSSFFLSAVQYSIM